MRSKGIEFRVSSLVMTGVLLISCVSVHVAEGKEVKSVQLKYDYCSEINNEISTIAKYDEDLLVAAALEEDAESTSGTKSIINKSQDDEDLVASIDKIFSTEKKKKTEERVAKENKEKVSTTATTATSNLTTEVKETTRSVVSIDLETGKKTYKEDTKEEETSTSKKKSGGKLTRGSAGDKEITKKSIKNSSATVATDNAGNTYKKGEMLGSYTITGYCTSCNDPKGSRATASGKTATAGITIAVNKNQIPLGTKVIIGDHVYIAEDVHGNKNYDHVADIYFGGSSYHGTEPLIHDIPIYIAVEN